MKVAWTKYILLISLDFFKAPFQILTLHRHIDLKSRHPQGAIDILMRCLKDKTSNNVDIFWEGHYNLKSQEISKFHLKLLNRIKIVWRFRQIFVAFLEYMNLKRSSLVARWLGCSYSTVRPVELKVIIHRKVMTI